MTDAAALLLIKPDWPAPDNIVAFSTCRTGGISTDAYDCFNVAFHVNDNPAHVAENRQRLLRQCDGLEAIQWLKQVHGNDVICCDDLAANSVSDQSPVADACYSQKVGVACAVMTADCLPVLFCDTQGQQVAAAHAGWRGLAAGVLENTVQQLGIEPANIMAWLGPAISQAHFEVGPEVRQVFLGSVMPDQQAKLNRTFKPGSARNNHYFFDLYQAARLRLHNIGVTNIYGGDFCTYQDSQRFYSYRRDGETGRMATVIYRHK